MKHYAMALVWAWLAEHPEYYSSWVGAHTQLRWSAAERKMVVTRVAGHWRRLANWGGILPSVGAVCRFERLVRPALMEPQCGVRWRGCYGSAVSRDACHHQG